MDARKRIEKIILKDVKAFVSNYDDMKDIGIDNMSIMTSQLTTEDIRRDVFDILKTKNDTDFEELLHDTIRNGIDLSYNRFLNRNIKLGKKFHETCISLLKEKLGENADSVFSEYLKKTYIRDVQPSLGSLSMEDLISSYTNNFIGSSSGATSMHRQQEQRMNTITFDDPEIDEYWDDEEDD